MLSHKSDAGISGINGLRPNKGNLDSECSSSHGNSIATHDSTSHARVGVLDVIEEGSIRTDNKVWNSDNNDLQDHTCFEKVLLVRPPGSSFSTYTSQFECQTCGIM